MRKPFYILFIGLFIGAYSFGQTAELDSLYDLQTVSSSVREKVRLTVLISEKSLTDEDALHQLKVAKKIATGQPKDVQVDVIDAFASYHYRKLEYDQAIAQKIEAVEARRSLDNRADLADALYRLAQYQRAGYQLDEAVLSYREAGKYYDQLDNPSRQINCLNGLGVIHKDLGDYTQALPLYHQAYNLAVRYGLDKKRASTAINIGVLLKKEEDYDGALEQYRLAEEINLEDKNYYGLANVYNNIGNVFRLQEKYDLALKNYQLAILNRRKSGKTNSLSYTFNNISLVYKQKGDVQKAIEYLKKSEAEKIENKDFETLSSTYLNFSEVYLENGDDKNFVKYATLAEDYALEYDHAEIFRFVRINYSKFAAANGNYEEAYLYLQHVYDELDTLDKESQKVLTSVLQAQFDDQQSKSLISTLSKTNAELDARTTELEEKEASSNVLIMILGFVTLFLVISALLLFFKQRAYARQTKQMNLVNEQLRTTMISKEEKETLLKEVHHRVKNNLQIIKSLIRLQGNDKMDERTQIMLLDFENRVSSMALVHESMYKSGDLAVIDINNYYNDLINDLIDAYSLDIVIEKDISIQIGRNVGIDTLVPLGLLTNEIISNSLKHAFAGKMNGTIKVVLSENGDSKELLIGDDGVGFDIHGVRENEQTLGLELINALVEQLDGEYEFINDGGSYFRIKFDGE